MAENPFENPIELNDSESESRKSQDQTMAEIEERFPELGMKLRSFSPAELDDLDLSLNRAGLDMARFTRIDKTGVEAALQLLDRFRGQKPEERKKTVDQLQDILE
ncbi:MAG: hypothetical protein HY220_00115 [Candidatus Sungbacteria bacterium]|uniref:Uncharacterized protein n=1 Tax=Candidatus Sungiibacteriota bacterium TaxID=2750080 RepID=A0A9D6QRM4_9BACT|nr:hypothetical protein [Candidatus Sungbacteria bacterium]